MLKMFGYFTSLVKDGLLFKPQFKLTDHEKHVLAKHQGGLMEIRITDPRQISSDQRAKIYAMFGDIDRWQEYRDPDYVKHICKAQYCYENAVDWFSLSDCSMERANSFIKFLIDFCLKWDIPWSMRTMDMIDGDYWLCYYGLVHRQCCICRNPADIAHITAVGRTNRNKIDHRGKYVMPLCRTHHQEQHTIGISTFMKKYHIKGVKIDDKLARILNLGNWRTQNGENE